LRGKLIEVVVVMSHPEFLAGKGKPHLSFAKVGHPEL